MTHRRSFLHAICILTIVHLTGLAWTQENPLQVLWLIPGADLDDRFGLASSLGPFALAIEVASQEGLLHNRSVNVTWGDSACHPKTATGQFVRYLLRQRPDVVFGPPCTTAMIPVADLASFMNIPIFSWVSNMHELDDKSTKTTLLRTVAPLSSLGELLIFFCEKMNWYKVSMISTVGERSEGMANFFKKNIETNEKFYLVRDFGNVRENANRSQIERMYEIIKTEARIIILVIPKKEVRRYLVIAYDMGMANGEYQFLYTERTVSDKSFSDYLTSIDFWKYGDSDDEKARKGLHNLLYFTYPYVTEFSLKVRATAEAANRVFGSDPTLPAPAPPDRFSRFLYDAFYLYSLAYNETVYLNVTPDGQNIFQACKGKLFQGETGRFLVNDFGDRQSSFVVWDMGENDTFRQVVKTQYTIAGLLRWEVIAPILWGNGRLYNTSDGLYIPPATPACGFYNELCPSDDLLEKVVPGVVVSIMLAGFIAFLIMYRYWRSERALYETVWKVKYTDLNFNISRGPISQAGLSVTTGSQKSLNEYSDNRSESSAGNMSSTYSSSRHDNMVMISQMFTSVAKLNGDLVAVRKVRKKSIKEDKQLLKEMKLMKSLKHTNLAAFCGACIEAPNVCVLWEYCSKGSLEDILHNTDIKLESMFQFSLASDICTGLSYLHTSELEVHGRLKASNCVIDSRWVAKLCDFGLKRFKKGEKPAEDLGEEKYYTDLFWTAPEILRPILQKERVVHTREADMYSLGVVLKQLLCKNLAYSEELIHFTPKEIIMKVAHPEMERYMRPHIAEEFPEHHVVMMSFVNLIKGCWAEDPTLRPNIKRVLRKMKRLSPLKSTSVLDNMLVLMERYSTRLEDLVSERTLQLEEEKRKTDTLLYRMLPRKVADDLKFGHHVQAEAFPDVTIYFSDIVGFTTLASESTPMEVVEMLNLLYSQFDNIIQNYNVYKVETIGDAYMVVCGCPEPDADHASVMGDTALALLNSVINFVIPHRPQSQLRIRIGLNSGPVVAGVVGNTMPRYCLFGNAVNLASRMESQGLPQKIQISFFTHEILKDNPDFIMEARGLVEIKGKGKMPTYWLIGRKSAGAAQQDGSISLTPSPHIPPGDGETDGDDGNVTKQRTGRQSGCGDETGGLELNPGGSEDGNSVKQCVPGGSPKKSVRQASSSSTSSFSYMSLDNTQNTLTSITDIEEVSKDNNTIKKQPLRDWITSGPNLNPCLESAQPYHSLASSTNNDQISTDNIGKDQIIKNQRLVNSSTLDSIENPFQQDHTHSFGDDYIPVKADIEKNAASCTDSPYMSQKSVRTFPSETVEQRNQLHFDNETVMKISVPEDIPNGQFPGAASDGMLTPTTQKDTENEVKSPVSYSVSAKDTNPAQPNFHSTISINTGEGPCEISLNITPFAVPTSLERTTSQTSSGSIVSTHSPVSTSVNSQQQVTPMPSTKKSHKSTLDSNKLTDLNINEDAFSQTTDISTDDKSEHNIPSSDQCTVKYSPESTGTSKHPLKYIQRQGSREDSPRRKPSKIDRVNGFTDYNTDHIDMHELNPFIDKNMSSENIAAKPTQRHDHHSEMAVRSQVRPLSKLEKRPSGKFSVHPTVNSQSLTTPYWTDKTSSSGKTKTFEGHLDHQTKDKPEQKMEHSDNLAFKPLTQETHLWSKDLVHLDSLSAEIIPAGSIDI